MSDYIQTIDFTAKDSLSSGNPAKVIRGSDFDTEFTAIAAAVSTKADQTTVDSLNKGDVGLGNVDNTSDLSKPISTATQTALDAKQATLVSGTNIKTVGGVSVLGSGDIAIPTAITPLGVVTGTNVATLDITGLDTWGATYDRILVMGWVYADTDANGAIRSQMKQNGVWHTTSYQYFREVGTTGAASLTFTNSTSTTFIPIMDGAFALPRLKANINIDLFRVTENATMEWSVVSETVTASIVPGRVRGMADRSGGTQPFQGIRLYAATGNVTGTFRVYGIKNS